MPRATIVVTVDQQEEVAAADAWFAKWSATLTHRSENSGCGCCVDIYDVEGPSEAIEELPEKLRASSAWVDADPLKNSQSTETEKTK